LSSLYLHYSLPSGCLYLNGVVFEIFSIHRLGITGVFFFVFVSYEGLTSTFIALHVVDYLVSGIPVVSLEFIHLHLFPFVPFVLGFSLLADSPSYYFLVSVVFLSFRLLSL